MTDSLVKSVANSSLHISANVKQFLMQRTGWDYKSIPFVRLLFPRYQDDHIGKYNLIVNMFKYILKLTWLTTATPFWNCEGFLQEIPFKKPSKIITKSRQISALQLLTAMAFTCFMLLHVLSLWYDEKCYHKTLSSPLGTHLMSDSPEGAL